MRERARAPGGAPRAAWAALSTRSRRPRGEPDRRQGDGDLDERGRAAATGRSSTTFAPSPARVPPESKAAPPRRPRTGTAPNSQSERAGRAAPGRVEARRGREDESERQAKRERRREVRGLPSRRGRASGVARSPAAVRRCASRWTPAHATPPTSSRTGTVRRRRMANTIARASKPDNRVTVSPSASSSVSMRPISISWSATTWRAKASISGSKPAALLVELGHHLERSAVVLEHASQEQPVELPPARALQRLELGRGQHPGHQLGVVVDAEYGLVAGLEPARHLLRLGLLRELEPLREEGQAASGGPVRDELRHAERLRVVVDHRLHEGDVRGRVRRQLEVLQLLLGERLALLAGRAGLDDRGPRPGVGLGGRCRRDRPCGLVRARRCSPSRREQRDDDPGDRHKGRPCTD